MKEVFKSEWAGLTPPLPYSTTLLYNFFHFLAIFANFWSVFAIFTLFGAFSLCTVGTFLAIFPIFLGFVGIFWGTPASYFADFGAILAIFDHFWTIFGPNFFFLPFLTENPENPKKIRWVAVWRFWGKIDPPPEGGFHT